MKYGLKKNGRWFVSVNLVMVYTVEEPEHAAVFDSVGAASERRMQNLDELEGFTVDKLPEQVKPVVTKPIVVPSCEPGSIPWKEEE